MKFSRPKSLYNKPFPFCPGCGHGIIHRILAETLEELGVADKAIGLSTIGCTVRSWAFFDFDMCQASHGRAPATATGIKRVLPEYIVFTYQGDGDLAAIGTAEVIHAAARGENITVIFVNNAVFGMTGGQMAPTTLPGQATTTTPRGRDISLHGYPLKVCELLLSIDGAVYLARGAVNSPKNILRTKKLLAKAFRTQMNKKGFSLVEILSQCPTNWRMSPVEAIKWVDNKMVDYYPLKEFKDNAREAIELGL